MTTPSEHNRIDGDATSAPEGQDPKAGVDAEKRSLQQSLRDTWLSALGVVTDAPGEVGKAAHRLLEQVGLLTKEGAADLLARVKKNREALERRVDDGVRSAVTRVRQPFVQEIANLRGRVERLQRSVEEFRRRRAAEGGSEGDARNDG